MLQNINRRHAELRTYDPELEARIQAYELAFRMQTIAPEAFEVEKESEATKKLYGLDEDVTSEFGWQCLLARRLAQRGCSIHPMYPQLQVGSAQPALRKAHRKRQASR